MQMVSLCTLRTEQVFGMTAACTFSAAVAQCSLFACADNITLSAGGWARSGTVEVGRDVVLAPAGGGSPVFLDFGRLPYAIVVQSSSLLAFDRVMVQGARLLHSAPRTCYRTE
jgi:hypothetical protein